MQGCKKPGSFDCFKSNGPETTEVRNLDAFSRIELEDKIDIVIVQGTEYKAEVSSGKHIMNKIFTGVENGTLKIENRNKCNVVRGYKKHVTVTVTLPRLAALTHNSVSDIRFDGNFVQDSIYLKILSSGNLHLDGTFDVITTESNGNGDLYLSGSTKYLNSYTRGTNFVHAEELIISEYAGIQTVSIGDVYLNGSSLKRLKYYIGKSGNIYYSGNITEITGYAEPEATGQVIKN
ncbi:MAG: DUF2807 domain-containing protein [Bacteroidia bacterium]|nr:DUF2807 domain-containing protein [Bacteroidia bacterium]